MLDRGKHLVGLDKSWRAGAGDSLPRRSFHEGVQAAPTQLAGRSGSPVTAGVRGFPPVLARMWHAAGTRDRCRPTAPKAVSAELLPARAMIKIRLLVRACKLGRSRWRTVHSR